MNHGQEKILDRIRKILAKVGRGATEEEAQTAVAMARRLMEEHQLSMADVDAAAEAWADVACHDAARMPPEAKFICTILRRHFFVRPLEGRAPDGRRRLHIFGEPEAVGLAVWLYGRLVDQCRSLFRGYRARACAPATARTSYYTGLTIGLSSRLAKDRVESARGDAGTGRELALADREAATDAAMHARFPNLRAARAPATRNASPEGFLGGLADSRKLSVARPLAAQASPALPAPGPAPSRQGSLF